MVCLTYPVGINSEGIAKWYLYLRASGTKPLQADTRSSSMLYKTNTLDTEVPSPTVKMNFLHIWILAKGSSYGGPFITEQVLKLQG